MYFLSIVDIRLFVRFFVLVNIHENIVKLILIVVFRDIRFMVLSFLSIIISYLM